MRWIFELKYISSALLFWFVDGFNYGSNSVLIKGILSIISVDKGDPHFCHFLLFHPIVDEFLDLGVVHILNVVNVAILLPLQCHILRQATVAKTSWIWFMLIAVSV